MRTIITVVALFLAGALSAVSIECTFIGLDQSYESKFLETVPFNLDDDSDSTGMVLPPLGPYTIEMFTYEGNLNIGIEISGKPLSGVDIPVAAIKRTPTGETIFGLMNAYHAVTNGFIALRYECVMSK